MREINDLLQKIRNKIQNPREELPEEIFLFATEITPMVNVDLLIKDKDGRILLSWRNDRFYDKGWHVPGGILRLQETFEQRIQLTALEEIGCRVEHSIEPIEIVPIICEDMIQRSHFISFPRYVQNVIIRVITRIMPNRWRALLYKKKLR